MTLRDDILAAMDKLRNEKPKLHIHVVHPEAYGWVRCADCGEIIYRRNQ